VFVRNIFVSLIHNYRTFFYFQQSSFTKVFDWAYTNAYTLYAPGDLYFNFIVYYTGEIQAWPVMTHTPSPRGICMVERRILPVV